MFFSGRIESHEAVTAYGREALLRAKETAEDAGFIVLHMYVDGLWVKRREGRTVAFIEPLTKEIAARTGLPIVLEGIYRWVAFLPSRLDERIPVPNRYFGLFQDGTFKKRGIEARRRDTPLFVAQVQEKILRTMAAVPPGLPLHNCLPAALRLLSRELSTLKADKVSPHYLVVSQTLSKTLDEYRWLMGYGYQTRFYLDKATNVLFLDNYHPDCTSDHPSYNCNHFNLFSLTTISNGQN